MSKTDVPAAAQGSKIQNTLAVFVAACVRAWSRLSSRARLTIALGTIAIVVVCLTRALWQRATTQKWQGLPIPAYAHSDRNEERTPDGAAIGNFFVAAEDANREELAAWFRENWQGAGYTMSKHDTTGRGQIGTLTDRYEWHKPGGGAGQTYTLWLANDTTRSSGTRVRIIAPPPVTKQVNAPNAKATWQGPRWQGAPIPVGATTSRLQPGLGAASQPGSVTTTALDLVEPGLGYPGLYQWVMQTWSAEGYRLVATQLRGFPTLYWYDPATDRNYSCEFMDMRSYMYIKLVVQPATASSRTPLVLGDDQRWNGLPLPTDAIPNGAMSSTVMNYQIGRPATIDQVARWFVDAWRAAGGTLQNYIQNSGQSSVSLVWTFPNFKTYTVTISLEEGLISLYLLT